MQRAQDCLLVRPDKNRPLFVGYVCGAAYEADTAILRLADEGGVKRHEEPQLFDNRPDRGPRVKAGDNNRARPAQNLRLQRPVLCQFVGFGERVLERAHIGDVRVVADQQTCLSGLVTLFDNCVGGEPAPVAVSGSDAILGAELVGIALEVFGKLAFDSRLIIRVDKLDPRHQGSFRRCTANRRPVRTGKPFASLQIDPEIAKTAQSGRFRGYVPLALIAHHLPRRGRIRQTDV